MNADIIVLLNQIIKKRQMSPMTSSYTSNLLMGGEDAILKKLGEEYTGMIKALIALSKQEIVEEVADLIYHIMVAARAKNVDFMDVLIELEKRHLVQKRNGDEL